MQGFIGLLMRGGVYGHYWFKQSRRTLWWPTTDPCPTPNAQEDTYFGVHPSTVRKGDRQRVQVEDVAAINCLYADIDSESKAAAAQHIRGFSSVPSVIIDSGGGYHCYWLLDEPFTLDTPFKLDIAKSLQERWVAFVGGDPAVHDLARILRLPGTYNYKYDPPRPVKPALMVLRRTYTISELEGFLPVELKHRDDDEEPTSIPETARPNDLTYQEVFDRAKGADGGNKFAQLWQGWNEGYDSASEADLAFCCVLAFWTGGDYHKIDKLFRASDRMRDKWERRDYRHETILKALGQVTSFYVDPGGLLSAGANDEGNAQCMYARNKHEFLYCSAFGWMHYMNGHWAMGGGSEASVELRIIKTLKQRRAAAARGDANDKNEAIMKAARPATRNVMNCKRLLRPMLTVREETFDTSLDELNCLNGTLNLRKGTLTPHRRDKRFSYCVAASYDKDADQSVWRSWLLEAVGGNEEVTDFIQEAVGYSLTGRTNQECMFYIWGPPRAGKGIFTETIQALLGGRPLATEVGIDMFLETQRSDAQGFNLAGLKACRFIVASESKDNQWLDAAKLKRWTGGSPITCAHKYQRAFTFHPQFKIWLVSNYPIRMNRDDIAGWTRPIIIHFPNSWVGREDIKLKERMRQPAVLAGVLAWAVEGAVRWYANPKGLVPPEVIVAQKQKAMEELDWVAKWIDEVGLINTGDDKDRLSNADLMASYKDWCDEQGISPKKQAALRKALIRMKFTYSEGPMRIGNRAYRGLKGAKFAIPSFRRSLEGIGRKENCEV